MILLHRESFHSRAGFPLDRLPQIEARDSHGQVGPQAHLQLQAQLAQAQAQLQAIHTQFQQLPQQRQLVAAVDADSKVASAQQQSQGFAQLLLQAQQPSQHSPPSAAAPQQDEQARPAHNRALVLRRALLMPQVKPGSSYRGGKSALEQLVRRGWRKRG